MCVGGHGRGAHAKPSKTITPHQFLLQHCKRWPTDSLYSHFFKSCLLFGGGFRSMLTAGLDFVVTEACECSLFQSPRKQIGKSAYCTPLKPYRYTWFWLKYFDKGPQRFPDLCFEWKRTWGRRLNRAACC